MFRVSDFALADDPSQPWEDTLRAYSMAYAGRHDSDEGDKVILPASILAILTRKRVQYPMVFMIHNPVSKRITHVGVREFVAEEGKVYMPRSVMQNLKLSEGGMIVMRNTVLPKARFVKLQPHSKDFIDISNPKAVLEMELRKHSALTREDTILVRYMDQDFYLNVLELKPGDACSIIETDCEVDFAPPLDYVEPVWKKPAAPAATAGAGAGGGGGSTADASAGTLSAGATVGGSGVGGGSGSALSATAAAAEAARRRVAGVRPGFVPFSGTGQVVGAIGAGATSGVGGAPSVTPSLGKTVSAGGVIVSSGERPSTAKARTLNKFEQARAEKAFTGTGRSIRD